MPKFKVTEREVGGYIEKERYVIEANDVNEVVATIAAMEGGTVDQDTVPHPVTGYPNTWWMTTKVFLSIIYIQQLEESE